jgi:hypothetical protein
MGVKAMKLTQLLYSTFGFVVISLGVCSVHASTAVYEDAQFLSGEFHLNDSFTVTAPGRYEAQLFDYHFPAAFTSLSLLITQDDPIHTILGVGFGTSSFIFDVLDNDMVLDNHIPLSVHVTGLGPEVKNGIYGIGAYGLQILPIPVPSAIWLFLSGVVGIITVARRERSLNLV